MSIWNSMLNWVEHENSFITSGPVSEQAARGAFDLPGSKSGFEIMVLIHRFIWISNRVDHTQFMILSESITQDGGVGVLHRFIWANQKYDSETSKSYSVQVSKRIKYIPWIIES